MTPREVAAEAIAEILHEALCTYNHTDGCPWELYDKGWDDGAHAVWKNRALWMLNHAFEIEGP